MCTSGVCMCARVNLQGYSRHCGFVFWQVHQNRWIVCMRRAIWTSRVWDWVAYTWGKKVPSQRGTTKLMSLIVFHAFPALFVLFRSPFCLYGYSFLFFLRCYYDNAFVLYVVGLDSDFSYLEGTSEVAHAGWSPRHQWIKMEATLVN